MKTLTRLLALCALALSGCATITKDITSDIATVRDVFNSLLPADFSGPVNLSRTDMYVNLTLVATNVHKGADGQWSWASVDYHRTLSMPWFAGLTWKSDVQIHLGDPNNIGNSNMVPAVGLGTTTTTIPGITQTAGTATTTVTTAVK